MHSKRFKPNSPNSEETDEDASEQSSDKAQAGGDATKYSDFARRQMAKMGHVKGRGLGKEEQGTADIVVQQMQLGRRGLGMKIAGFEPSDETWEFEEVTSVKEAPDWLPPCTQPIPSSEELSRWALEGKKKLVIHDETLFCSSEILNQVLECKTVFDTLEGDEFVKARTRANPYETIKGAIFQNRAACKLANMDKVFNFMLTFPKTMEGKPLVGTYDLFYFADICAGPGGFSEYILWRRKTEMAKGFGLTLKSGPGVNDFKLDEFYSAPVEFFEPHYGVGGADGDGDIMNSKNLETFRKFVLAETGGKGVHLVTGDGGFSVAGQENIQEILSKQLSLCQFLCALSVLREGGNFVCKTFDLFTPFSVGLVYLLYRAFDHVCIIKPLTSRPANSERFVVCQGLRSGSETIHDYLFQINERLNAMRPDEDVVEVVPLEIIQKDSGFSEYMTNSNESIGKGQIKALRKLRIFIQNTVLSEGNQAEIRKMCLEEWKIPDEARAAPKRSDAKTQFESLWKERDIFQSACKDLSLDVMKNVHNWRCCVFSGQRKLLLSLGRTHVYGLDLSNKPGKKQWIKSQELASLELPADTLLEVNVVKEYEGEGSGQKHKVAVYVTDGLVLCGKDISKKHYKDRISFVEKLAKAVNKSTKPNMIPVRVYQMTKVESLEELFSNFCFKQFKGRRERRLAYNVSQGRFLSPSGILFFRHLKEPWSQGVSKSTGRPYFYNPVKQSDSVSFPPPEALGSYNDCLKSRLLWQWGEHDISFQYSLVHPNDNEDEEEEEGEEESKPSQLTRTSILNYIKRLKKK
ncbi:cap-specific mRNA (nucleoside-2'-O-)-methyltransferase 1-like [Oscarella lobularis]|uniref:cap-specific mRNA (nucleoside-2'-O-)-methyltransferase 1-like n=1 Tax=Oscarella lobularis TaxID=121494 RepID=UPI0033138BFC